MIGGPRRLRAWWLRRSLRYRITVAATGVTLACLLALTSAVASFGGAIFVDAVDGELGTALTRASTQVAQGRPVDREGQGIQLRVLDTAGAPADGGDPVELSPGEVRQLKAGDKVLQLTGDPPHRWLGQVVYDPTGLPRLVVAGMALVGYVPAVGQVTRWLAVAALVGAAFVGTATWLAARSALRPVERMRAAAGELPAGRRLPVPEAKDELRALAEALNALLARRDEATERLRRFTGDAAHELRSPVASVRAQAEVAVMHPDPEFAQEVLQAVAEESERLSDLLDALLTLSRSDAEELVPGAARPGLDPGQPTGRPLVAGPAGANRVVSGQVVAGQPVDVVLVAQAAIDRMADAGPPVRLDAPLNACLVWAPQAEVDLVVDNLLRNAARYARALIRVSVLPAGREVRLLVDDDGHGIPAEHRERVFDRFYRVEADRGRGSGGFGLGLALVAATVRRRGGRVWAAASPEGGARVEARWPAVR
ncbi:sensor histidine kinase [Goodfellowiella coeruleoviolacea]|uniref:histidine kinase n=1 Tax=Goodfellowiella coeruleoviolacea TaxID=334858 RepID=A0AAE3KKP5_9PSEU|nr:HAMP domain-containing sensor histidine kinase [Goodfellowiella coeruleoviolacea]MCP2165638.1 Signal transduction histidine kinase [Goodfellowiella coeruleoviolacea]